MVFFKFMAKNDLFGKFGIRNSFAMVLAADGSLDSHNIYLHVFLEKIDLKIKISKIKIAKHSRLQNKSKKIPKNLF